MPGPKRILIVEDEVMIAMDIEATLTELGHVVQTAVSLNGAEAALASGSIDLAIVDYHLQGGTSAQLASRLHSLGIPFIVCSGSAGLEELGDAFRRGTSFLPKPFTTDGLVAAVGAIGEANANVG